MPDPLSIIRLAALLAFIALVAVGLWLLDVAWWVVPPVMALALFIAWTIEWLAWRGTLTTGVVRETTAAAPVPVPPPVEESPLPAEAIVPLGPAQPAPARPPERPPAPEREPEPPTAVQEPPSAPEVPQPQPAPEPEPRPAPPREPEPAPPEPEPAPPPEREPEPPPAPVTAAPPSPEPAAPESMTPSLQPERRLRRPRRMRLRPLPAPPPVAVPEPPPQPQPESPVVAFRPRAGGPPRSWNLWDLERIAREGVRSQPERRDEWAYLFLHLRQFASADGSLPTEFDGLVRESFGGLLDRSGA